MIDCNKAVKAIRLAEEIYGTHSAGCCLHIVLDDGNVLDEHVEHCLQYAKENNCETCIELAEILVNSSKVFRRLLFELRK